MLLLICILLVALAGAAELLAFLSDRLLGPLPITTYLHALTLLALLAVAILVIVLAFNDWADWAMAS